VQTLECLDDGKAAPVDSFHMPHGNRPEKTTNTVSEQANRNDGHDNRGRTEGQIVEQVLRREDFNSLGRLGCRSRSDGADGMLLQTPRPIVEELENPYLQWQVALATIGSPFRFEFVAAGKGSGPSIADKVGYKDDKGTLDGNRGGFKLSFMLDVVAIYSWSIRLPCRSGT
jgi:hypothetical protein